MLDSFSSAEDEIVEDKQSTTTSQESLLNTENKIKKPSVAQKVEKRSGMETKNDKINVCV